MDTSAIPQSAKGILLQDAIDRDPVTARRMRLLGILLHERYLTRQQLIVRVEGLLGKGCFGKTTWKDTFYRDIRMVKKALQVAGCQVKYSRKANQPGYYLFQQPAISAELTAILTHSIAEVDPVQIAIWKEMSPAERFRMSCSITDAARRVAVYR